MFKSFHELNKKDNKNLSNLNSDNEFLLLPIPKLPLQVINSSPKPTMITFNHTLLSEKEEKYTIDYTKDVNHCFSFYLFRRLASFSNLSKLFKNELERRNSSMDK